MSALYKLPVKSQKYGSILLIGSYLFSKRIDKRLNSGLITMRINEDKVLPTEEHRHQVEEPQNLVLEQFVLLQVLFLELIFGRFSKRAVAVGASSVPSISCTDGASSLPLTCSA